MGSGALAATLSACRSATRVPKDRGARLSEASQELLAGSEATRAAVAAAPMRAVKPREPAGSATGSPPETPARVTAAGRRAMAPAAAAASPAEPAALRQAQEHMPEEPRCWSSRGSSSASP